MSADKLRQAANVLREPTNWSVVEITDGRNFTTAYRKDGRYFLDRQGDEFGCERIPGGRRPLLTQTGEFHTLMRADLRLALAAWLDDVAAGWAWDNEGNGGHWDDGAPMHLSEAVDSRAVTIADLILGGA